MPPESSSFTPLNLPSTFSLPQCMEYFTLTAGPNTDLWRKPPNGDTSTAPIVFTSLRRPFVVAEVTVSADWEMEWDQGGLVIFAGAAPSEIPDRIPDSNPTENATWSSSHGRQTRRFPSATGGRPCKWVKAGIEFSSGTINASSVSATTDDGADWCLSPLPHALPVSNRSMSMSPSTAINSLRIKFERIGHSLWIWYQLPSVSPYALTPGDIGSSWKKFREVSSFFYGVEDKFIHVGVYASRPANMSRGDTMWAMMNGGSSGSGAGGDGLVVEFEDLEIF